MARRYDSRTTIFSPEGRLYQVEYAMEAISHAGTALGVLAADGVVLAAEKKVTSKLLEQSIGAEKIYVLDSNIACAVAGITADANTLVQSARVAAQRHRFTYQTDIPVEQLVQRLCDQKQGYTQFGGLRPYGVSLLYAGYDEHFGFQLYTSDPSGNYAGWKANVIGANSGNALGVLKTEWKEGMTLKEARGVAVKTLAKTMDTASLTSEKLEFATLSLDERGKPVFKNYTPEEIEALLKEEKVETIQQESS